MLPEVGGGVGADELLPHAERKIPTTNTIDRDSSSVPNFRFGIETRHHATPASPKPVCPYRAADVVGLVSALLSIVPKYPISISSHVCSPHFTDAVGSGLNRFADELS